MLAAEILLLLLFAAIEFAVGLLFAWAFARMFQVRLSKRTRLWMATVWAVLGVMPTVLGINGGL